MINNSTGGFSLLQKLAILAVSFLGLWMYAPALQLPPSLIDEIVLLRNKDQLFENFRQHGLVYAIQHGGGVAQQTYNTGFWWLGAFEFVLTADTPFHWLRLFELATVCALLFCIVCAVGSARRGAVWGGLAAVMLFLIAEVPGAADLQALRINWYRLFSTDADALVFLALFAFATVRYVISVLEARHWHASIWALISIIASCAAFSIKIPFCAVIISALGALAATAYFAHERRLSLFAALVAASIGCVFLVYNLALRRLHIDRPGNVYGQNYSLDIPHLWSGFKYYANAYWNLYGPLFPAMCSALPWALYTAWRDRHGQHKRLFLCLIFFIVFTASAILIYLPWNSRLPRYMLVGVFGFNIIIGLICMLALQTMSQAWRTKKSWLLLLPAGVAAAFLPPLFVILFVAVAGGVALFRQSRGAVPFLAGAALVGIAYTLAVAPAVRTAANYVYVHREKANWQMTMELLKCSAQNRNICFAGSTADEHLGSMSGHVNRMGIQPRLYPASDRAHCGPDSLILVHGWLSPKDAQNAVIGDRRVVNEIGAIDGKIPVPVSFWEFRSRIGDKADVDKMVNYWETAFIWRIYDK